MKKFLLRTILSGIILLQSLCTNGQSPYPIQQIINGDTVIISTVKQINQSLIWRNTMIQYSKIIAEYRDTIVPILNEKCTLLNNQISFRDSIIIIEKEKFKLADSTLKQSFAENEKINKKLKRQIIIRNTFIALSTILLINQIILR